MPSFVTPKKNTQFIFYTTLRQQANANLFQTNPTIAAGDFKVSTDGAALGNLGTLPVVTPAGSTMVKITLSTSEMNGDNVTVICSDAAGAEWCDLSFNIQTSARQIDDLAYPTTSGRSIDVATTGEVGLDFDNVKAASAPTTLTNITVPTVTTTATATNLTNAPTAGDFTATMKTSLNAATPASVVGAVGSVTGNIGGNLLGTLTSTERNLIAAALLKLDWTTVTGAASRSALNALRFLRNKWVISASTLSVLEEDNSTAAWTSTLVVSPTADPVTGSTPT